MFKVHLNVYHNAEVICETINTDTELKNRSICLKWFLPNGLFLAPYSRSCYNINIFWEKNNVVYRCYNGIVNDNMVI